MSRSLNKAEPAPAGETLAHMVGLLTATARLRPIGPIAREAILVGDPGRALLLAQVLLEEPKMSNHARGLWGYSGRTPDGRELTIQSTGMGGPSAAIVLTDLAELGVRRAVRVGTCRALDPTLELGDLLAVAEARAEGGVADSFGVASGDAAYPDPELGALLERELTPAGRAAKVASFDVMPAAVAPPSGGAIAADLQTATVLACGKSLGIAVAVTLIVAETTTGERADDSRLEGAAGLAGKAAVHTLSG